MSFCFNVNFDATAKSPKNAAKTTATLQNQVEKVLLTLASILAICGNLENRARTPLLLRRTSLKYRKVAPKKTAWVN